MALALMLGLVPLSVSGVEADWFLPSHPLEGRRLFTEKRCVSCHSVQGIGGQTGPDLGEVQLGDFAAIASNLWNHFPRMKEAFARKRIEWPTFTEEDAKQLFTFIYFLNYFDKAYNLELGGRLFLEKQCSRCHSVDGKGGHIGPELDAFQVRYAAPFITAGLWNSGQKMTATMHQRDIARPSFQEHDVVDILAFIRQRGASAEIGRNYLPLPNPVQGQGLFQEKGCIRCHAIRGKGGTVGPDLSRQGLKGSLSYILSRMWNHGPQMWSRMQERGVPYPKFTPAEMSDLISYLYFLQFEGPSGSPARGAAVLQEKRCAYCHFTSKPGEKPIGPMLVQAGLDSPFKILSAMWNHAPAIEARMREQNIRWPILEREEMNDLVAFILSINLPPRQQAPASRGGG
jgi:mono/diheme cytochrome c family protein